MSKKTQNKSKLIMGEKFDIKTPLAKKFFDVETELLKFLNVVLPHVSNSTFKVKLLYKLPNDLYQFRVNYYKEQKEGFVNISKIVSSKFVTVENNDKVFKIVSIV